MTVQLALPALPRYLSNRAPLDKVEVTYAIELVLDRVAEKHGISHTVIAKAIAGYVDDMLSDVFFDLEEDLRAERDDAPYLG